jgi:hypothetical protein
MDSFMEKLVRDVNTKEWQQNALKSDFGLHGVDVLKPMPVVHSKKSTQPQPPPNNSARTEEFQAMAVTAYSGKRRKLR